MNAPMTVWTKVLATASGTLLAACSAAAPEPAPLPEATLASRTVESPESPPPPPPSPLPDGFHLPGPGGAPAASATGRVIWVAAGTRLLQLTSGASTKVEAHEVAGLATGEALVGLDFRKNGTLYAVGSTSRLYAVAPSSAIATPISFAPFAAPLLGTAFGFGFDPVSDLARVTSNTTENIRVEAETGTVTNVDGALRYATGDGHAGAVPRVTAVAYDAGGMGYAVDASTGSLARIVDSYSGTLESIGPLGVTATDVSGFDISGNDAFVAFRIGTLTSLGSVDLATGKVTSMGTIGDGGPITGLAIQP